MSENHKPRSPLAAYIQTLHDQHLPSSNLHRRRCFYLCEYLAGGSCETIAEKWNQSPQHIQRLLQRGTGYLRQYGLPCEPLKAAQKMSKLGTPAEAIPEIIAILTTDPEQDVDEIARSVKLAQSA